MAVITTPSRHPFIPAIQTSPPHLCFLLSFSSLFHLSLAPFDSTRTEGRDTVIKFLTDLPTSKHEVSSLDCQPINSGMHRLAHSILHLMAKISGCGARRPALVTHLFFFSCFGPHFDVFLQVETGATQ